MECSNENGFSSHLPQPKPRGQTPAKLLELTESAGNARALNMPPPPAPTGQHKRKPPVENGGEPMKRYAPGPAGSRPGSAGGQSNLKRILPRQVPSSSTSSSTRPTSFPTPRNPSTGSLSNSLGSVHRTASSHSQRSQSVMEGPRTQKAFQTFGRPMTAFGEQFNGPGTGGVVGNPKNPNGMTRIFSCPIRNPRGHKEMVPPGSNGSHRSNASGPVIKSGAPRSREDSPCSAMHGLRIDETNLQPTPAVAQDVPVTPSQIPRRVQTPACQGVVTQTHFPQSEAPSPSKSPQKPPKPLPKFLTRDSNTELAAWDHDSRLHQVESDFAHLKGEMGRITHERSSMNEMIAMYKTKIEEVEENRKKLISNNAMLQMDLDAVKTQLSTSCVALEDSKRYHNITLDDLQRHHRRELDDIQRDKDEDVRHELRRHQEEMEDMRRQLQVALEEEKSLRQKEVRSLTSDSVLSQQKLELELDKQQRVIQSIRDESQQSQADMARERQLNHDLRAQLSGAVSSAVELEASMGSLRAHIKFLESDNKTQSQAFADLETRMQNAIRSAAEANDKLRIEETLRRKLHNQVQELKGNIRVFCRVRPPSKIDTEAARITYPDNESDSRELEVLGLPEKSSLGTITTKTNAFAFDRVFGPQSANADIFGEISQLVQSALDGYNVCIFCYGQTGSGKTFTMSSTDGMIPLAVNQIYNSAKSLEEKGWKYSMEGSFVEVYNENLNDLLGKADEIDKKKLEIRHDMQKGRTTITDVRVVELDSPNKVESMLRDASANRSVAATNANERSSRSHSVFILRLVGENSITGERSEGTLNLVDLAGSERLSHSGATGDRLKETQSINKSLSCLGDVIGALGQGKKGSHVPYRNSTLTYLLQLSLGGNSKTLMFVMISPLQAHLSETLTSLKFATKVHNTHIGTAKRQTKIKD